MRITKAVLALSALALGACSEVVSTQDAATAESTAIDRLIDTRISTPSGTFFLFRPGGVVEGGTSNGDPIVGTYVADASEVCSTLTAPASIAGEYCSMPVYDGDTVIFHRRNGTKSPLYTIGG